MPELPEVETVVRELRPRLVGRRFVRITVGPRSLRSAWSRRWNRSVIGNAIRSVRRRGKWIIVDLEQGHLLIHLGMTGQLTSGDRDRPRTSHTHWVAGLDDKSELRFRDIRRFGSVAFYAESSAIDEFLDERLGPEPFEQSPARFGAALQATERTLKAVLLDQVVIAGIGNIYADESLFVARLSPRKRGCDTTPAEARRLLRAIVRVLTNAIERRGSTIRNYVGGSGLQGSFQREFRVYGRDGEPCFRCRASVHVIRLAGRSTHFCPNCQQLPSAAKTKKVVSPSQAGTSRLQRS